LAESHVSPITQAADALGRAFQSDPLFDYLVPQPEARSVVLPAFFGMVAGYSHAHGALDLAPEGQGAACWLRPGHTAPAARHLLPLGATRWRLWRALVKLGWGGMRRLSALSAYANEQHRRAALREHWYLWAFGVDPDRQRQGVGGQLLQAGLARADADRLQCYLETNNVLNLIFYQKRGFKVVSRGQPAGHELTFWAMRRDPR
jgi:ribosomal protein S18 acetylase RimI-like enzyme